MTIQELRIGNYIYYNKKAMKIAGIISSQPLKDKKFSDKYIIELYYNGIINTTLEYISPIPNRELLEKTNFKLNIDNSEDINFKYYSFDLSDNKYCDLALLEHSQKDDKFYKIGLFPYEEWFNFQYIHELQNIIFDLTNKELEFKI